MSLTEVKVIESFMKKFADELNELPDIKSFKTWLIQARKMILDEISIALQSETPMHDGNYMYSCSFLVCGDAKHVEDAKKVAKPFKCIIGEDISVLSLPICGDVACLGPIIEAAFSEFDKSLCVLSFCTSTKVLHLRVNHA